MLSGTRGSGTLFFAGCHLHCLYCQNHQISQFQSNGGSDPKASWRVTTEQLASQMLQLQESGAHNISLVSPTPHLAAIVVALQLATQRGLHLPVVYNSSGYDNLQALSYLDGLVDIYLPDLKYASSQQAERLSGAANYPQVAQSAIQEMQRQVGDLQLDQDGVATAGLIIRHLVLPKGLSQTKQVLTNIAREIGPQVALSLMAQYYPAHRALQVPGLETGLSEVEYQQAVDVVLDLGFENGFVQELDAGQHYRPDFARAAHPFE